MQSQNPLRLRQFFATISVPCPYLPMRSEQKLVIELRATNLGAMHTQLSRAGFRRSHHLAYRPACRGCQACVPVRIDANRFVPTRSLRRTWRTFAHLSATFHRPVADAEHFALFQRYVSTRHADSEMAMMEEGDFAAMLHDSPVDTVVMSLRDGDGVLIGACLLDRLQDGLSAVYSYFDPAAKGSLGSHIVMRLVQATAASGKPYVYLGYWIDGSDTMAYKSRFPGVEALTAGRWAPLAAADRV
jgi:arginyl-tRNA--protein-N-Asp/Glu arginylyltransferase